MTSAVRGWMLGVAAGALLGAPGPAQAQPAASAEPGKPPSPGTPPAAEPRDDVDATQKPPPPKGDAGREPKPSDAAEAEPKKPTVTGGYSWSDAPRAAAQKKKRVTPRASKKLDRNAATATFPGFRPLPSGGSVVFVSVSKEVPVRVHEAAGRLSYMLQGAQVQSVNNTHPLVTTHFNTPVERIRLVPAKGGVELLVELREAVKPELRIVKGPRGMMLLELELPPPSKRYAAPTTTSPLRVESGAPVQPSRASGKRR